MQCHIVEHAVPLGSCVQFQQHMVCIGDKVVAVGFAWHLILFRVQDGVTGPLRAERDALKERLDEVSSSLRDANARLENVTDERNQLQFQLSRIDEKLSKKERYAPHFVFKCVISVYLALLF